ncbi:fucose isomerase [Parabacteroides sp. PF5-9]|uniref:L-fucose/L-arabinose isomerase family protein n=1 Tax=Parabacteroides sp. PF5-9 TaxID=1742404 RepID=UPI002474F47A|nr:fucose isomerase [Parabacteroides sp. PF5-9]MDH6357933.1 L-fucose isomerase-like protein [Parabacteroides sp. PF5-9]
MKNKNKMCFGVIIGTRAYFNSELARDVRKQLLKTLTDEGYDYVILPEDATPTGSSSIETREDGLKCAALFKENRECIDGIIISLPNFGFEIGIINAISVANLNVPILVQACDDENDKVDLDSRRDAFCGKISVCNNLYQYGIPFTDTTLHTYSIYSDLLAKDINKFAGICRVVNGIRGSRIGAIGARPLGFNTVRASEKILQASGMTVVPVDLSEIIEAARAIEDNAPALLKKMDEIRAYATVPADYDNKLPLVAKFGLAVDAWIEEADVDAVAIQCWDSLEKNFGCATCVVMSMLGEKLLPAACEMDLAGAVAMYALTLASNQPSALVDWNNNFAEDRNKCVCTHCGNFPKSFVNNDLKLGPLGVLGRTLGKINTFGAVYGKVTKGEFTYFRISTDDPKGIIKSYLGEGTITDEPYNMDGCIAVTKVDNLQGLMKYICKNGFEHHVAVVRTGVRDILQEAIENYLGWDLYVHS